MSFVVLAAWCWGLSGGIGGLLMSRGWDASTVAFCRGAIGWLIVLAWQVVRPPGGGLASLRLWFWSAVAGIGVAGNFGFYFLSISQGGVAVAVTLMYCAPVIVYSASAALGLERATVGKGAAVALVTLGIALLARLHDIGPGGVTPTGVGAGLLAGLSYALFIFGFKNAAPHGAPRTILAIAFTVLVLLMACPLDSGRLAAVPRSPDWPLFAVLGMLGAGVSFALYLHGLKRTTPTAASIVALVEPVTASLFGVAVLGETLGALQLLGMGLILVTVTVMAAAPGEASGAMKRP